jgi:hypothetical protein
MTSQIDDLETLRLFLVPIIAPIYRTSQQFENNNEFNDNPGKNYVLSQIFIVCYRTQRTL